MGVENEVIYDHGFPWVGGQYSGQLVNNVPHGWGKLHLPNGTQYEGEWQRGKPHGEGTIYYPSGKIYKGGFSNGKRHGHGKLTGPDGRRIKGTWEKGRLVEVQEELKSRDSFTKKIRDKDMINIENLTFRYRSGKGIFNLNFTVEEGEVFGYLGPNGAGKTTTIRNLLGFTKPAGGRCRIDGLGCWKDAATIQDRIGYLPGEMAFFEEMTGTQFLNLIGEMRGKRDKYRRNNLIDRFELETAVRIRRMSKGMKQKLGIVAAFMNDPAVYILDEPTSGLDPLMRNIFIELILEERDRGKTILMSSHNFEETYRTCDRAGIIREGRLAAVENVHSLKTSQRKPYLVTLESKEDIRQLRYAGLELGKISKTTVEVFVSGNYDQFIAALAKCRVLELDVGTQSLEQVFLKYYGREAVS